MTSRCEEFRWPKWAITPVSAPRPGPHRLWLSRVSDLGQIITLRFKNVKAQFMSRPSPHSIHYPLPPQNYAQKKRTRGAAWLGKGTNAVITPKHSDYTHLPHLQVSKTRNKTARKQLPRCPRHYIPNMVAPSGRICPTTTVFFHRSFLIEKIWKMPCEPARAKNKSKRPLPQEGPVCDRLLRRH